MNLLRRTIKFRSKHNLKTTDISGDCGLKFHSLPVQRNEMFTEKRLSCQFYIKSPNGRKKQIT